MPSADLTADDPLALCAAARSAAAVLGVPMAIAVMDPAGT